MAFGRTLGDLAGQDIVLWREAGLDPNVANEPAFWSGRLVTVARRLMRSCRRSGDIERPITQHRSSSHLHAVPDPNSQP